MALTDQVLMPGSDYQAICDATRALTGTSATLKSGEVANAIESAKTETWVFNEQLTPPSQNEEISFAVNFESNSVKFATINVNPEYMLYKNETDVVQVCEGGLVDWNGANPYFRKVVITGPYSSSFKTWLEANAVKQTNNLAVQGRLRITPQMTENLYSPNAPYDVAKTVQVAVANTTKTVPLSLATGNQIVDWTPPEFLTKVTITKPATLIPENIKSGVNIGGVVGTMEDAKETWVFNESIDVSSLGISYPSIFTSNGQNFEQIYIDITNKTLSYVLEGNTATIEVYNNGTSWASQQYRKITVIGSSYFGDFKTWLETNAVKQSSDLAVQPSKTVADISTTIYPDAPYDAMAQVDVASGVSDFFAVDGTFFYDNEETEAEIQLPDGYYADDAAFLIVQNEYGGTDSGIIQEIYAFNPQMSVNYASDMASVKNALVFSFGTTGSPRMNTCNVLFEGSRILISTSIALTYFQPGVFYRWKLYTVPGMQ